MTTIRTFGEIGRTRRASIPAAENLVSTYKNDLEESLSDELVQFSSLLRTSLVKQSCYPFKEEASKEINMFCLIV